MCQRAMHVILSGFANFSFQPLARRWTNFVIFLWLAEWQFIVAFQDFSLCCTSDALEIGTCGCCGRPDRDIRPLDIEIYSQTE
jgi:hypothetical protein